ncbi:hypothetical protein [Nocardia sp. NPDC003963]
MPIDHLGSLFDPVEVFAGARVPALASPDAYIVVVSTALRFSPESASRCEAQRQTP